MGLESIAAFIRYIPSRISGLWGRLKAPFTPRGMTPCSSIADLLKWSAQRAWRGYSDWDASEANSFLAGILADVVAQHAKDHGDGGCPHPFYDDNYTGPTWQETLDTMAVKLRAGHDLLYDRYGAEVDAMRDAIPTGANTDHPAFRAWSDASSEAHDRMESKWKDGMDMLKEHLFGMSV